MKHNANDLTGRRFGYLTITRLKGRRNGKNLEWFALCDCGKEIVVLGKEMTRKRGPGNQSCGCMKNKLIAKARTTHGMSNHPAFAVWRSMVDRCMLPSHQAWHNYGGRGITVCGEWGESFEAFWRDMGAEYRTGLSLDRRDNDGPYCPENCHWTDNYRQANNRRTNILINTPWGLLTGAEASRASGINTTTLHYRLSMKWPPEKLFIKPDTRNRCGSTT